MAPAGPVTRMCVDNMTCQHCVQSVTKALRHIPGVRGVEIILESKSVVVQWQPGTVPDPARLLGAVKDAGFNGRLAAGGG